MRLYIFIAVRQWGGATVGVVAPDESRAIQSANQAASIGIRPSDLQGSFAIDESEEAAGLKFCREYDDPTYEG